RELRTFADTHGLHDTPLDELMSDAPRNISFMHREIRRRRRPGGVLAFSQRPPIEGCYGCQASYINRSEEEDPLVVKRWDYEPDRWVELLTGTASPR
ncbi:hypothetical protein ABT185_17205, partial [Streptomyces clavifer]